MVDWVDSKILKCLKVSSFNQANLVRAVFAREGMQVFRRRLVKLQKNRLIKIEQGKGRALIISLNR